MPRTPLYIDTSISTVDGKEPTRLDMLLLLDSIMYITDLHKNTHNIITAASMSKKILPATRFQC